MALATKKILIIRFSSIGDIVLTTPVVRALKLQLGAEVHYLTKSFFGQILEPNPYVDRIFTIKKELSEVLPLLKKEAYDCIIDLHRNARSWQVKRALRSKAFVLDKINWAKWLMVNFKINRLPELHIVDRNLAAVAALGIKNDGKGLDYFIPPEEEVNPNTILAEGQNTYIAFVIGAAHATKRLPESKIVEICRQIAQPIVLLGGPDEREVGQSIAHQSGTHVINTCGTLSLHQSASLVRQSQQVISHDTGLMHIAAAFQKDIISIWGNTIPAFGMYPYNPGNTAHNTQVEVANLSCRPCSKIGYKKCPKGHFRCMMDLDPKQVVNAILSDVD